MDSRNIFWGLICKPGKRYETEVQEAFRMTKACIDPSSCKEGKVTSLMVECDNGEEFIIANLSLKSFNESLDIAFNEGEKICFKVEGTATVHLTGNLLEDSPPGDMYDMETDSDDVEESEVEEEAVEPSQKRKKDLVNGVGKAKKAKKEEGDTTVDTTLGDLDDTENFAEEEDSDDDDDDEEDDSEDEDTSMADTTAATEGSDDSEDDDDEEEEKEPEVKKVVAVTPKGDKKPEKVEKTPKPAEKKRNQEVKTPKQDNNAQKEGAVPKTPKETKTPKAEGKTPKQEAKTPKQEAKTPKVEAKIPKEAGKTPQTAKEVQTPGKTPKKTLKGGIQVEDVKEGSGPECKPGNMVGMYYEGRLKSNNKKFDGLKDGKPFKFKLGSGQVIKGWDLGVLGMKVGGKRKLIIPPQLGFGSAGAPPDIPPNSTLVFDIECKFVK